MSDVIFVTNEESIKEPSIEEPSIDIINQPSIDIINQSSNNIIGPIEMIVDKQIQSMNFFINSMESDPFKNLKQFVIIYISYFIISQICFRISRKICESILNFVSENMMILSLILSSFLTFVSVSDYMQNYLKRKFLFQKKDEIVPKIIDESK